MLDLLKAAALFLAGLAWWSLLEYLLHRFVFHRFPRTLGRRHLQHHARLKERRLAMAPAVSALAGVAIHGLVFVGGLGSRTGVPLLAGLVVGYAAYEAVHYATHYVIARGRVLKALRRHHLIHHHAQPGARYGVTTPFWDWVFGTLPPAPGRGGPAARAPRKPHLPNEAAPRAG